MSKNSRLATWAASFALAVGLLIAAFVMSLTRTVAATEPLYAQRQEVPSAVDSPSSLQYEAAVVRARELVRAAIQEQNLPGVSVAVGAGGTIVWAEGFGWRDADTKTPVTPRTRFNIGTAASAVTPADVARLRLANTGAESRPSGVRKPSASRERTSRRSPSSATRSCSRSAWPSLSIHCRAIARRSTSRERMAIRSGDGG